MRTWTALAALVVATGIVGCAPLQRVDCAAGQYLGYSEREWFPVSPRMDCAMGDAVNMAIARQTFDKDAAARNAGKDAFGLDGSAARDAMYNYQKSFRSPEPAPVSFTIGGSGGQSSGGQ